MDPLNPIRNGFANGAPPHSHFYAAWSSRHESSMIPKALKFATLDPAAGARVGLAALCHPYILP